MGWLFDYFLCLGVIQKFFLWKNPQSTTGAPVFGYLFSMLRGNPEAHILAEHEAGLRIDCRK